MSVKIMALRRVRLFDCINSGAARISLGNEKRRQVVKCEYLIKGQTRTIFNLKLFPVAMHHRSWHSHLWPLCCSGRRPTHAVDTSALVYHQNEVSTRYTELVLTCVVSAWLCHFFFNLTVLSHSFRSFCGRIACEPIPSGCVAHNKVLRQSVRRSTLRRESLRHSNTLTLTASIEKWSENERNTNNTHCTKCAKFQSKLTVCFAANRSERA